MKILFFTALAALTLSISPCRAEDPDYSDLNWYPDAYNGAAFRVCPAYNLALAAPAWFYQVYGRWPTNWQEIVTSGLIQVPLSVKKGSPITPDDGVYDNSWDILYYPNNGGTPGVGIPPHEGGEKNIIALGDMDADTTFEASIHEIFRIHDRCDPDIYQTYVNAENNLPFLRLVGICEMCAQGLKDFRSSHGRNPATWQEFLTSGFSPIDANSINPVTGGPIYGDGRPNDIFFQTVEGDYLAAIYPTGADGKRGWWNGL